MSMHTSKLGPREYDDGRTKQSAEAECNINNIMAKYAKTGQLVHVAETLGEFRDISGIPDLNEAMNIVADANSAFNELPAEVRKACEHNAGNFLEWFDNPENRDEAVKLGLIVPRSKSAPTAQEKTTVKEVVKDPEQGVKPGSTGIEG